MWKTSIAISPCARNPPRQAVVRAVNEVRPPIILATLAVIISFVPMFFITGMMGPYMAPMALNVPVAMLMSLLVAFTITPWLSLHMLRGEYDKPTEAFRSGGSASIRLTPHHDPLIARGGCAGQSSGSWSCSSGLPCGW